MIPGNVTVAVIKPVFTSTPYSAYPTASFYGFYKKYLKATGNVTTDLGWLNTSVRKGLGYNSGWGHSLSIYSFLSSPAAKNCGVALGKNVVVISDINVTQGALFAKDGSRRYGAAVIGHQEYVTQAEFDQLKLFVASGGRLIAMSSNMFYAKVIFNPATGAETFVIGHGYAFNGKSAWHTKFSPFNRSVAGWFGSTYCCFHRFQFTGGAVNRTNTVGNQIARYFGGVIASSYLSHEENAVSNFSRTSIVATFINHSGLIVAAYVHRYGRGAVFCLCVFGEDVIENDPPTQTFLLASVATGISGSPATVVQPPANSAYFAPAVAAGLGIFVVAAAVLAFLWRKNR